MRWDPINNRDPTGRFLQVLGGAALGAAIGVIVEGVHQYVGTGKLNGRRLIAAGVGGAVAGGLFAATFGGSAIATGGAIGLSDLAAGGLIGASAGASTSVVAGDKIDVAQTAHDFAVGALTLGFGEGLTRAIRPNLGVVESTADDLVRTGEAVIDDPEAALRRVASDAPEVVDDALNLTPLDEAVNQGVAKVAKATTRVENLGYNSRLATAASRLGVALRSIEIEDGVARFGIRTTQAFRSASDIKTLLRYVRGQGARRAVIESGNVVNPNLKRKLLSKALGGKRLLGSGRVEVIDEKAGLFRIHFDEL